MADISGKGPYSYPLVRDDSYKSKITFEAIKILPPTIESKFFTSQTADEITGGGEQAEKEQSRARSERSGSSGKLQGTRIQDLGKDGEKASIYVPIAFQVNDGFTYEQSNINAAAGAALNRGGQLEEATFNAIKQAGKGIFDFFTGQTGEAGRVAAARIANNVLPAGVASAVGNAARVTMNPNIRTTFQGVPVREFSFAFEFLPKSAEESIMVKNLIRFFRFHSYPEELINIGSFSVAYNYPNLFRIKLLSHAGGIFRNIGTPIKMCYCTAVSANYNPTSQVLHADGSPVKIDLSLSFTEYKPLSRKDVINEDNDIFYQFETQGTGSDQQRSEQNPPAAPEGAVGDNFGGGE